MDPHEINLKDYLQVIWNKKWVILGITGIALAAGALFSSTKPNEYEATALVRWQVSPPSLNLMPIFVVEGIGLQLIDQIELMTADEVAQLIRPVQGGGASLDARVMASKEYISLRLWGPSAPQNLEERLSGHLAKWRAFFKDEAATSIAESLKQFEQSIAFFKSQKSELLTEIRSLVEARENSLQTHRDRLRQEMEQLIAAPSANKTGAAALYYTDLASRLQAIDQELIRLEADQESGLLRPGYGYDEQMADIQKNLQFSELLQQSLQHLVDDGWEPMTIIEQPTASPQPIGPSRSLNIVIAGILGLLLGLMAAFTSNYLQASKSSS